MAETLWTGVAQAYARSFARLCGGSIPTVLAGLPVGTRILDVGCGTGILVRHARDVGLEAVGVEPDPEMAALAGALLGEEVAVGGLPDLPHATHSYDAVVANFVLNHVDDPLAGARELARVAAPGAVVRTTIWGTTPPPQAVMWGALLDEVGADRPPSPRLPADRDFERSPDGLAGLLEAGGLAVTSAGTVSWQWSISPDDLWAGLTSVGNFGVLWRAQSADVQGRVRTAYDEVAGGQDFVFDVTCVLAGARVPRS